VDGLDGFDGVDRANGSALRAITVDGAAKRDSD
jgi:hypothetical protein